MLKITAKKKLISMVIKVLGENSSSLFEIYILFEKEKISKKELHIGMQKIIEEYSLIQIENNIFSIIESINEQNTETKKVIKNKGKTILKKHQIQKDVKFKKPIIQPMEVKETKPLSIKEKKKNNKHSIRLQKRRERKDLINKMIYQTRDNGGKINIVFINSIWIIYRKVFTYAS